MLSLDIHGSVHHDTVFTKITNEMQLCIIIYCFLTALHVSSDIFAHHQEHLNCDYSKDTPDDEQKYRIIRSILTVITAKMLLMTSENIARNI
jgi:hypothetical protein